MLIEAIWNDLDNEKGPKTSCPTFRHAREKCVIRKPYTVEYIFMLNISHSQVYGAIDRAINVTNYNNL